MIRSRHPYLAFFTLLLFLLLTSCGGSVQAEPNTLIAVKVSEASLDSTADFWTKAPVLEVPTKSTEQENALPGPVVTIQAVYDRNNIAIRFAWADPTPSIHKNGWTWDGSAFHKDGDEDRLMIHFPMTNDPEFSSKGCTAACHSDESNPEKWYMATASADLALDQWHWKSTRSNPVGQADDKYLSIQANPLDTESAHYGDALDSGGEERNNNDDRSGPEFMSGSDPNSPYILAGHEVPVEVSLLSPGIIVSGYVLTPMTGSRGDLMAKGEWADGQWVVVIMRVLETGHDDDVVFTPPKPVPFGLAVTDNDGGYKHAVGEEVLALVWK